MNLGDVQSALKQWISTLSGLPIAMCIMENERRPSAQRPTGGIAILSWVSMAGVGNDERRWTITDAAAPAYNATASTVMLRKLKLQVGFESFSQDPQFNSRQLAETFRETIYSESSSDYLATQNLGLINAQDAVKADYLVDGHWYARTVVEVWMNHVSATVDGLSERGTIDHAIVTSAPLLDVSGDPAPSFVQVTNEEMPPL